MHRYNYANCNPITGSDPTGYETYSELLTSISIQGTFVRSLTFGIINTGRIVVAKLLTSQQVDTLDVLETFAKSQLGSFFIETTFWETLPMINYGSGMFSGTKLGDKVNRVSGDLLNKYYSTPLSTVEEITSQNNKKTAIGMSEGGSKSVHGNSKTSTKPQHGYEIYNKKTGDVVKTGISGQPLNKNGTSPRANTQVNKLNKLAGEDLYDARIVIKDMPDRVTALEWEKENALKLWEDGNSMSIHKRPRPWEN